MLRREKLARRIGALAVKANAQDIRVVVKCVVTDSQGRVLALRPADSEFADLPGGHLHDGEAPTAGVKREVREETGLELADGLRELGTKVRSDGVTVIVYHAGGVGAVQLSNEHAGAQWLNLDEAKKANFGWWWQFVLQAVAHDTWPLRTAEPGLELHDAAREAAERVERGALTRVMAAMEHLAATGQRMDEEELLDLLQDTAEASHQLAGRVLGAPDNSAGMEDFAAGRPELLRPFLKETMAALRSVAKEARVSGKTAKGVSRAVRKAGAEIELARGDLVAKTEAQAAYGDAQARLLVAKGGTKRWVTMEDERVRETHRKAGEQGDIPAGAKFSNGLRFPGDPKGSAAETINCRCYLVEGGTVSASDVHVGEYVRHTPHGDVHVHQYDQHREGGATAAPTSHGRRVDKKATEARVSVFFVKHLKRAGYKLQGAVEDAAGHIEHYIVTDASGAEKNITSAQAMAESQAVSKKLAETAHVPVTGRALTRDELITKKELTSEEAYHTLRARVVGAKKLTPEDLANLETGIRKAVEVFHGAALKGACRNVRAIKLVQLAELPLHGGASSMMIAFYSSSKKALVTTTPDADTMAHELAHAVDKRGASSGYGWKYSQKQEWKDMWEREIASGKSGLRPYAKTNEQEGLACSVELVREQGMDALKNACPEAARLLTKWKVLK